MKLFQFLVEEYLTEEQCRQVIDFTLKDYFDGFDSENLAKDYIKGFGYHRTLVNLDCGLRIGYIEDKLGSKIKAGDHGNFIRTSKDSYDFAINLLKESELTKFCLDVLFTEFEYFDLADLLPGGKFYKLFVKYNNSWVKLALDLHNIV